MYLFLRIRVFKIVFFSSRALQKQKCSINEEFGKIIFPGASMRSVEIDNTYMYYIACELFATKKKKL